MSMSKSYSICGVNLLIECLGDGLGKRIKNSINDYFYLVSNHNSAANTHNITLNFKNKDSSMHIPEKAEELSASSYLRVLKDGDFCYLISGDSVIRLDLENRSGVGLIDAGFWKSPLKSRQDFLMLSLLWHTVCMRYTQTD